MAKNKPRRIVSTDDSNLAVQASDASDSNIKTLAPNLPKWAMIALSIFAVLHILACYAEPFRFSTQVQSFAPASDAIILRDTLKPYIDMMYLNHGYYFFAPNPGPAHLVVCVFKDGKEPLPISGEMVNEATKADRIVYPDKTQQKPRLLYHRYFMFTEFYNTLFTPQDLPNNQFEPVPAEVLRSRELYAALRNSLHHYFEVRYPNRPFEIYRVEHGLPTAQDYFEGHMKLDDPRLYTELPERMPPLPAPGDTMNPQMPPIPFRAEPPANIILGTPQEGRIQP